MAATPSPQYAQNYVLTDMQPKFACYLYLKGSYRVSPLTDFFPDISRTATDF